MEVLVQNHPTLDNFNNNSGTMNSSYLSPSSSSPKRLGEFYLSAPTSPSRISQLYGSKFKYYFDPETNTNSVLGIFNGSGDGDNGGDNGFTFFLNRETEESSRSAEELFDGGKIKPLELQWKTHHVLEDKKMKNELSDDSEHRRGRNRTPTSSPMFSSSNSNRRVTRSHSPYRTPQWEELEQQEEQQPLSNKEASILTSSNSSKGSSSSSSSSSSKRWRLKDLLLFRSASEGRGSSKDQFKSILYNTKKHEDVITKTSSFRSMDSSSSSLRRKGHVSAHELHYAMKRAEYEDMKKKTFLPYKQGILGRLSGFGI